LKEKDGLVQVLSKSQFYTFQIDSSTEVVNVEGELFLVIYSSATDSKIQVVNKFLFTQQPTIEGICFENAMSYMVIEESWNVLFRL